jgi:hypothetical protein
MKRLASPFRSLEKEDGDVRVALYTRLNVQDSARERMLRRSADSVCLARTKDDRSVTPLTDVAVQRDFEFLIKRDSRVRDEV